MKKTYPFYIKSTVILFGLTLLVYMLINLRGTYYHYCEMPAATFDAFLAAPSMGQFYNQRIKGTGMDGPFDCRTHRVPAY